MGELILFGNGQTFWAFDAFYQAFLKQVKKSFVLMSNTRYMSDYVKYYELPPGVDLIALIFLDKRPSYKKFLICIIHMRLMGNGYQYQKYSCFKIIAVIMLLN